MRNEARNRKGVRVYRLDSSVCVLLAMSDLIVREVWVCDTPMCYMIRLRVKTLGALDLRLCI